MSELLEYLKQVYVVRTPQMRDIGLEITAVEPARGTMRLPPRDDWLGDPERGLMHVGPLIVLADSACGIAVGAAVQARDVTYATLDLRLDWLRPALPGKDVYSEAHCYRLSRSVAGRSGATGCHGTIGLHVGHAVQCQIRCSSAH
jgi:uncharacterized protein (TIGR00369 family)